MNQKRLVLGNLDTNCYLVWADNGEGIVIDPADNAEELLNAIQEANITVTAIGLTHAHFDHMLAAEAVCAATGAPLWVGRGDEPTLSDPNRNLSVWLSGAGGVKGISLTADRLLQEGDVLSLGAETFTVWETPGHTPGCICLVGESTVISGDTLFCGSIGRTDFPGGDMTIMRASLSRLMTLPENVAVYSGHGPATPIGREKATNPFLR